MVNGAYNPVTRQWREIATGSPSGPSATVWTGTQVVMWGGGCCADYRADGWSYDPKADAWTPMPTGPLAGRRAPGVWTGKELVVVGGSNEETTYADGAAYNPTTKQWRSLPSLPAPRTNASLTWTGTEVLVIGGMTFGDSTTVYADGYAYNPATNRWRHLPSSGVPRTEHNAVWTGSRLLVWGGLTSLRGAEATVPAHGMVFDPATNRWSAMPVSPLKGRTQAVTVWTGTEMIVFGGVQVTPYQEFTDGAAYQP
jgi:N-acetylneuraminic acid mutarotase